mmetsp:Transcript_19166/g.27065  ORF Transcript_19166/g.27065 Transcript_19166/m.27065 type:complete len:517 (+) Transcript_19166:81-1631(+)
MLCNTKAIALVLSASAFLVEGRINSVRSLQAPDDIEYPEFRFISWKFLTDDERAFADTLGYVEGTWDHPGSAAISKKSFDELTGDKLAAAKGLGFNDDQWDCYVNHYGSYSWDDLQKKQVQEYFNVLGWTHESWRGDGVARPNTNGKDWEDLTSEERQAAKKICYFEEIWDDIDFDKWDCTRNHYSDYTWHGLEEEGVIEYFKILGWTDASWNGTTANAPESASKSWNDLTEEQHVAARKLCFLKQDWDGPAYPTFRYRSWKYVSSDQKANAEILKYTEDSWNNIGSNKVEKSAFDRLESGSVQAAKAIGFEEEVWDCFINHYEDYDWDELFEEGVQSHYHELGWLAETWKSGQAPASENLDWDELTPAQQEAAEELCYQQESWEKIPLDEWDCAKTHYFALYYTWADLKRLGVQQYFVTLGWDHMAWRQNEAPPSETKDWNQLTKEEEAAARNLCYHKEDWNDPPEKHNGAAAGVAIGVVCVGVLGAVLLLRRKKLKTTTKEITITLPNLDAVEA